MIFSFVNFDLRFHRIKGLIFVLALLVGCSGGGSGSSGPIPEFVTISGTVTYDRVPFNPQALRGLDFNNIEILPARGVSVQLVDVDGFVVAVTSTDDNGQYSLSFVSSNQLVRIRVFAELSKTSLPSWDVKLLDHTSDDAQYVLDGALVSSGIRDSTRDLHAESGWDISSSSYVGARAAAPFAILDSIYTGLQRIVEVDNRFRLDELEVFWSPDNNTASLSFEDGDIGSSFYSNNQIYLLGQQDSDTDEFDQHVIIHEWAHFIEDVLSRSDTLGGGHNTIESLDVRLAFAEGLANSISGIATDDPIYRDSFGVEQSEDFNIDLEANPDPSTENAGWFVESSIHSLIYDLYDTDNEGADNISLGFQPIYDVLTDSDYINSSALLTIYPFIDHLRAGGAADGAAVDQLLLSQNISGSGIYGVGEFNDGGDSAILPIYIELNVNGAAEQVCTTNNLAAREINKLGNRRFVRFTTTPGVHTMTVTYSGTGFMPSNPAFVLYRRGQIQVRVPEPDTAAYDIDGDSVMDVRALTIPDEYVLEVFSRVNVDGDIFTGGDVCFDVSVAR